MIFIFIISNITFYVIIYKFLGYVKIMTSHSSNFLQCVGGFYESLQINPSLASTFFDIDGCSWYLKTERRFMNSQRDICKYLCHNEDGKAPESKYGGKLGFQVVELQPESLNTIRLKAEICHSWMGRQTFIVDHMCVVMGNNGYKIKRLVTEEGRYRSYVCYPFYFYSSPICDYFINEERRIAEALANEKNGSPKQLAELK